MTCSEHHIRHCMLYEFNSGKDATTATENICAAYGTGKMLSLFAHAEDGSLSFAVETPHLKTSHDLDDQWKLMTMPSCP